MTKESSGLLLLPLGRGLGCLSLPALRIPLLLRALGAIMGIALGTKGRNHGVVSATPTGTSPTQWYVDLPPERLNKIDADLPQGRAVPVI